MPTEISPIDQLEVQEYSKENPRVAFGFEGENALLRPVARVPFKDENGNEVDLTDRVDMMRSRELWGVLQKDFFDREKLSDADLIDWLSDKSPDKKGYLIFGVAGNKGTRLVRGRQETFDLPEDEKGELQGWVFLDRYPQWQVVKEGRQKREMENVREMVALGIIPKPLEGQPPLQLAYAKLPGTEDNPTANGQMASAIRQLCAYVGVLDYLFHEQRIEKEVKKALHISIDTPITALNANQLVQFRAKGRELWENQSYKPTQIIACTISPRNPESMRVAEAAGFVRSPIRTGKGTIEGDNDYYYVLDWDKLDRIMKNKALQEKGDIFQKPENSKPVRNKRLSMPEPSPIDQHEMNPHLRYIDRVRRALTEPVIEKDGATTSWLELDKKVKPYNNPLEFSEHVHDAVYKFIRQKIPSFKERVPAFNGIKVEGKRTKIKNQALLEALVHNWFDEEVAPEGQRREVLLAVAAHVVERIETRTQKELLKHATPEQLKSLGLNPGLRNILVETMDVAEANDPFFLRFLAYSRLTDDTEPGTLDTALFLPDDKTAYTTATLFPKESKRMARGFRKIAQQRQNWQGMEGNEQGADAFAQYLNALSDFYEETDPQKAKVLEDQVLNTHFRQLYLTNFPILIIPPNEPSIKEPYYDPEMRVCLAYVNKEDQERYQRAKTAMARSLYIIGQEKFQKSMESAQVKDVVVLGNFGTSLVFNAAAQEKPYPLATLFLNEQRLAYDKAFPDFLLKWVDTHGQFSTKFTKDERKLVEFMSRMNTVLHEYSHFIHPDSDELRAKFGDEQLAKIDEVKAEIAYRGVLAHIVANEGLDGTREQWDLAMLASELQILRDDDGSDDAYNIACRYVLNPLFREGVVVFNEETKKYSITDYRRYEEIMRETTMNPLALYENLDTTPAKAAAWLKTAEKTNELVEEARDLLTA